jgi:AraC-like DNA-binding protein
MNSEGLRNFVEMMHSFTRLNRPAAAQIFRSVEMDRKMWKSGKSCGSSVIRSSTGIALCTRAGQIFIAHVELGGEDAVPESLPLPQSPAATLAGKRRCERHLRLEVVRRGRMTIEQSGETLIFSPGDMLLVDPALPFSRSICEPTHIAVVHIPKRALRERGLSWRFASACQPVHESGDVAALRSLLLAFTGHVDDASDALVERLSQQFLDLMDVLLEHGGVTQNGRTAKAVVARATQLITRRLADPGLSVASLAGQLNLSLSSLTRAFRQHGLSPMRYAYALRLEHAGRLLAETPELAIKEVADRCGFASAAHFSRLFKQKYGVTPREYANAYACSSANAGAETCSTS